MIFDTAREHKAGPRKIFRALDEVLPGQERGPRFGAFAKLVGRDQATALLRKAIG